MKLRQSMESELAAWNNGAGIDLASWVGCEGRFALAVGYATVFWPEFEQSIIRSPRLIGLALSILVVLGINRAVYGMNADDNVVYAEIVNYLQAVEYRIAPHGAPTQVAVHPYTNGQPDALARIIANISAARSARRQAAAMIHGQAGQSIQWADLSPDNRLILAGFQDPSVSAMTSATVFRVSDLTPILRVNAEGRIRDSLWSQDSRTLTILESTEHMKKTPWGLLAAISGHPIELQTYYVRRLDIDTRSDVRVRIADDIENGEAELRSHPTAN
jgi:hypothetical protein